MNLKRWEDGCRTTMICIDSYDKAVLSGRFYNQHCPEGIVFYGAIDLIKKMEIVLERMNFPQPFSVVPSFEEKPVVAVTESTKEILCKGKLATFSIRVIFRQNASWQGTISWHEGKCEETFRSVLELLLLIDSAVNSAGA